MNYVNIQNKLDEILDDATDLPLNRENTSVALNSTNTKSTFKSEYIRSTLQPTKSGSKSLGPTGVTELTGLFMVDVFVAANADNGVNRANILCDKILSHFKEKSYELDDGTCLRITDRNREQGREFTNYYMLTLSIEWSHFYKRSV